MEETSDTMSIYVDAAKLPQLTLTGFEEIALSHVCGRAVYLIEASDDRVKIGFTSHPQKRVKSVIKQGGAVTQRIGLTPSILNAPAIEAAFKARYSHKLIAGEWYAISFSDAKSFVEHQDWEFDRETAASKRGAAERKREASLDVFMSKNFGIGAIS